MPICKNVGCIAAPVAGVIGAVLGLAVVLWMANPAAASSVHLKGGSHAEPAFVDGGLTLSAAGELSGLGFGDVLVTLTAMADTVATCTNNGTHQAPGQNPAPVQVAGSLAIPQDQIKNGNTPFGVVTQPRSRRSRARRTARTRTGPRTSSTCSSPRPC